MTTLKYISLGLVGSLFGGCTYLLKRNNSRRFLDQNDASLPRRSFLLPPERSECYSNLISKFSDINNPLDVLIIGGGATGSGIALDLSTRGGLDVALVEANDYASETSSRSTKLIHGGVRYLEKAVFNLDFAQLKLVIEALGERSIMLHQAPYLCNPLAITVPCYSPFEVIFYWTGMKFYDLLAASVRGTIGGNSKFQLPITTLNKFPMLKHERDGSTLVGSIVYYDGQMDDARLCTTVALTAATYGANVVNHCRVIGIKKLKSERKAENAEEKKNDILEVTLKDEITGEIKNIYSKAVVNATGPFNDEIKKLLFPEHKPNICPSRGTHITLPSKFTPLEGQAILIPSNDGRVIFAINWLNHCIAGTTDTPCAVSSAPRGTVEDVKFIINNLKPYMAQLDEKEVLSVWSGIRPLAKNPSEEKVLKGGTQNIVREHFIKVDEDAKMLSICGGKWTTYRKMADDTVKALIKSNLIDSKKLIRKESVTSDIVLHGGKYSKSIDLTMLANLPEDIRNHWIHSYGDKAPRLYDIATYNLRENEKRSESIIKDSEKDSKQNVELKIKNNGGLIFNKNDMLLPESKMFRLCPSLPITDADVIYCCQNEHTETVEDFISRRSRMTFLNAKETLEFGIPRVAEIMAREKFWSKSRTKNEIDAARKYLDSFYPMES